MKPLHFLIVLMSLQFSSILSNAQCGTCTINITANSSISYTLTPGQTLCINPGITYTGDVTMSGGTLCNRGNYPSGNINVWQQGGTVYNSGTMTKNNLSTANNLNFYNTGTLQVYGDLNISSGSGFYNNTNGVLNVTGSINNNSIFNNAAAVDIRGAYNANSSSTLNTNSGSMSVGGSMNLSVPFSNTNTLLVKGDFRVNGGSSFTNGPNATLQVNGLYENNSLTVNNGSISINGNFTNNGSGTFTNNKTVTILGNFLNNSAINGNFNTCNPFIVYGSSIVNNGSGSINNNDICRKSTGSTFTSQYGTVGGSVTYCTCSAGVTPLPIVLKSFTADCKGNDVAIDWTTSTEINNAFFTVSRSSDAISWETFQVVAGSMNSNQEVKYSVTDARPLDGTSYYRLHQTDLDGTSEYFSPVSVSCSGSSDVASVSIYPNPVDEQFTISIQALLSDSKSLIEVYDLTGRKKLVKSLALNAGTNSVMMDRETLAPGTYTVRVISNGNVLGVQKAILR